MAETLRVALEGRGYDIIVGERLLALAGEKIAPLIQSRRAFIVTDETVAALYLHRLMGALEEQGIGALPIVLPPGEQTKSFNRLEELLETILEHKPDRNTPLIALGGGVVGDITGFAAAILLRGVPYIQIPTTLLAQVDSAVGGKTAVNSRFGKNLIGSFHQPALVISDVSTLKTLPRRELLAGYAEVVKYGLIGNAEFFAWLEENAAAMLSDNVALLTRAVIESCRAKAAIVADDEREQGRRALLNFGHTFAHAFEAETGYGDALLHGEAVALGMGLAFAFSVRMGLCPAKDAERVRKHFAACGLPISPLQFRPRWNVDALIEHFSRDKKTESGRLTFVLTRGIGRAFVAKDVERQELRKLLADMQAEAA